MNKDHNSLGAEHVIGDTTITGDTTLTGEHSSDVPTPVVRAKNKNNVVFFSALGVLGVCVLAAGYMAFLKHKAPVPAPMAFTPAAHVSPKLIVPPVKTGLAQNPAVTPAKLATPDEAQALLGGAPAPAHASTSLLPATGPAMASTAAPSTAAPSALGANPVVASTPALASTAGQPAPTASVTTVLPVATPALAAQLNAPTPSPLVPVVQPVVANDGALTDRVTHLESRLDNLESGQARILDLLSKRSDRDVKHVAPPVTDAQPMGATAVVHLHPRRHVPVTPVNSVELVTDKKVDAKPSRFSAMEHPTESCHLASIVPNRAWTKQADGTFMTYGIGDKAPNGAIIKSIDPDAGIVTDKGKLNCAMSD